MILTYYQISRIIPGWKKIDLKPIYLPPTKSFPGLQKSFKRFLVDNRDMTRFRNWKWDNLHVTTRMGPVGPALNCASFEFPTFYKRYGYIIQSFGGLYGELSYYLSTVSRVLHL